MFNKKDFIYLPIVKCFLKILFIIFFCGSLFSPIIKAQGISYSLNRRSSSESISIGNFENIDPYTGNLTFNLPLVSVGGRGGTQTNLMLGIESTWKFETTYSWEPVGTQGDAYVPHHIPLLNSLWNGYSMGPGKVFFESGGANSGNAGYLKLIFATQNGRQIELIDALSIANPGWVNCTESNGRSWCSLGNKFISTDGSGITFLSDTTIYKGQSPDNPDEEYPNARPTGYLLFPDGSRMRVEEETIVRLDDVNGNRTTFEYEFLTYYDPNLPPPLFPIKRLVKITDSLNRETRIQYDVNDPLPYGRCNKIFFKGADGEDKVIRIEYRKLASENLLRSGLQPKTVRQLFPLDHSPLFFIPGDPNGGFTESGVLVVNDEIFDPYRAATVWLPDGRSYKFRYDNYGALSRVELPTGAAIEYDWSASTRNHLSNVGLPDVSVFNSFGVRSISRRLIERRVYERNNIQTEKVVYSRPGYCVSFSYQTYNCQNQSFGEQSFEKYVDVDFKSSANALRNRERHFYLGLGEPPNTYPSIFGYSNWHTGKEYITEYYGNDGTTLLKRLLSSYKNKVVPWVTDQNTAPPFDTRTVAQLAVTFENGTALGTLKRTEYDENGQTDPDYFSHLNVKRFKTYNYKILDLNAAKTGTIENLASLFSENDLVSVSETDYLYSEGYKARHILGLPAETRTLNPANQAIALTKGQFLYDEQGQYYSMADYGPTIGYEAPSLNYAGLRGNITTARTWNEDAGSWIQVHYQFDNFGNLRKVWDAGEDPSRYVETEYSAQYYYAFPTKRITPPPDPTGVHGTTAASVVTTEYNFWTGNAVKVTDDNGQITTIDFDDRSRPKRVTPPVGEAIVEREYGDTPGNLYVKVRRQVDSQNWAESTKYFDNLGRFYKTQTKDRQGDVFSELKYDDFGRINQWSNPYRQGEEKFWAKARFDNANRVIETYAPAPEGQNGASLGIVQFGVSTAAGFVGSYIEATDASGRKARSITDIFGQIIRVDEPTGNNNLGPLDNPTQPSVYAYNAKRELVKIEQGQQRRYFKYDSLGRLTRVKQPEQMVNPYLATTGNPENNQWTIGYTYDIFGNVVSVIDAKNNIITNAYDKAGRIKTSTYLDGTTPQVDYYYDGTGLGLSQLPQSAKGNLTKVSNGISESKYTSFDDLGRVVASQQITDNKTYDFGYKYDNFGNLSEETYPSLRVVKTSLDADGGLSSISSKTINSPYKTYASNFDYTAAGAIKAMMLGNGRWETAEFTSRLQLKQIGLGNSQTDTSLWKVFYEYGELNADGSVNENKNIGNVAKQTITLPGSTFVQTYKYDQLNRLKEAIETTGTVTGTENWKQTFDYDRYGNRTSFYQKVGNNVLPIDNKTLPEVDPESNRFKTTQGYFYDFNGNLIQDAENRGFTYNGDDRQTEVRDLTIPTSPSNPDANLVGKYYYDGEGKRVKKITNVETTIFVYDAAGNLTGEYSTQLSQQPTTSYLTTDALGSPRVITDKQGNVISRRDFMPFGEEIFAGVGGRDTVNQKYSASGIDNIRQRFTGYQKDDETDVRNDGFGLDFAQARMYQSRHGRFTTPDPLLASASLSDPQTFNRYNYVGNNPVYTTDSSGLGWCRENGTNNLKPFDTCPAGWGSADNDVVVATGIGPEFAKADVQKGDLVQLMPDNSVKILVRGQNQASQIAAETGATIQAIYDPVESSPGEIVSQIINTLGDYGAGITQGTVGSMNPFCLTCDPKPTDSFPQRLGQATGSGIVEVISLDIFVAGLGGDVLGLITGQIEAEPVTLAVTAAGAVGLITSVVYQTKLLTTPMQMTRTDPDSSPVENPRPGSPALKDDPYSPGEVNKRQSQTRSDLKTGNLDPDSPIPDQSPGKNLKGSHSADTSIHHKTGERNVGTVEEHSRRAKGGYGQTRK